MWRLTRDKLLKFLRRREMALAAGVMALGIGTLLSGVVRPSMTCFSGDMRARYAARVPSELADIYLDAEHMDAGFGAAALGGWEGLGDAIAVGGRVYVRHTNRASPRYYELASNRYFQSNAFVYVPVRRAASERYRPAAPLRVDELVDALARAYPQGVIATGVLRFAPLRTIAMSAPAIDGQPIAQRAVRYYTRPMEFVQDSWAYVVLMAAGANEDFDALLPPPNVRTVPAGHALALRLRELPSSGGATIVAENAVSVGQLLKGAIVIDGELALYPVKHALPCRDARTNILP